MFEPPPATEQDGFATSLCRICELLARTMWAYAITAPGRLERVEAPEPQPRAPGRVLVELKAGGICGSDLPSFHGVRGVFVDGYGEPGFPLHEVVGEVVGGELET